MMKVAHIIDSGGFYGAEVMLLNLCREQINQGLSVEVISIGVPGEPAKELENKLREENIPVTAWRMRPLPDPRESLKLIRYCKSKAIDIIHSHGYKGNILLSILPRACRKIPVVSTVHGYTRQKKIGKLYFYQMLDKVCLKRLDAIVIVSKGIREQILVKSLVNKLYVINNGLPNIVPIPLSKNYDSKFKPGELKIGALGRLSFEKNFSLAINAMKIIVSHFPQGRLVIYGEGPLRNELQRLIDENSLSANIQLPGYLRDTQNFFAELDIFVNCSLTEGMPISLLEAMRQGCRIVATNIEANRTLLESLPCKTYICPLDPNHLAQSIMTAATEPSEIIEEQRKCYQNTFTERFSSELMAKEYSAVYKKLTHYV